MKNKYLFTFAAFALLLLVTFAYKNHFNNPFHFDDGHTIVDNLLIRDLSNIPRFFKDATTFSTLPTNQSYRPLVSASLAVDYWIAGGLNTFWFHLSMFVFFIAQLVLMFFLFLLLVPERSKWLSLSVVAWYGLHTANAETLNYIISRSDSYSTLLVVLALLMYVLLPRLRKFYLYLLPAAAAMFVKEAAVVFPTLLFAYIFIFEERRFVVALRRSLPAFVVCVALILLVIGMAPQWQPGGSSKWAYFITQPLSVAHYLTMFLFPFQLCADTDAEVLPTVFDARFFAPLFLHIALLSYAWIRSKDLNGRAIAFGIFWFYVTLVPTSSFLPLSEVRNDHRMFFPFVGLSLAWICWLWEFFFVKIWSGRLVGSTAAPAIKNLVLVLFVVLLFAHAWGVRQRSNVWRSDDSLWLDVAVKAPRNGRGLMNYGVSQMSKGNYLVAENYFIRALALWPNYSVLHINLGVLNGAMKKAKEAEQYFTKAIALAPQNPQTYFFYAKWLRDQGRTEEAKLNAEKSLSISSGYVDAQQLLKKIKSKTN